ncbi:MAG: phosphotransferase [Solirubrobacteraceae bacterium]
MLAQEHVARWLLDRGLLAPGAVLDGDLVIRDASSRNRNFRVESMDGPCYLLKQGLTLETAASVAHEASVYQQLSQGGAPLTVHLPRLYGYDPTDGVLVLELVRDAQDLRAVHLRTGRFSAGPAALLGAALGAVHRETRLPAPAPSPAGATGSLWLHRPDARVFRDASAAALELIGVVQGAAGFSEALDRIRGRWRQETLVHGDVKWDNCLLSLGGDGEERLRLIDWESAFPGDPSWDIGSALSHYLSFWLFSIPVTGSVPPERFPELAGHPLDTMKPALAACWIAYADARGFSSADSEEELLRAVEYAGVRLLQTAFEAAQMMQQLTSAAILHLQLALNILQRPEAATTDLLGLNSARVHAT